METDQDQLRKLVKRRCIPQTIAAGEMRMTNVHLNYCMKNHKNFGPKSIKRVIQWIVSLNKKEAEEIDKYLETELQAEKDLNEE